MCECACCGRCGGKHIPETVRLCAEAHEREHGHAAMLDLGVTEEADGGGLVGAARDGGGWVVSCMS